ncbi:MAG: hypothetical protein ACFCUT_06470 [Kiloniellaceae bacterium]
MENSETQISGDKALELQKILIRQEMQEEITSWAKKRFAMLGVAAAILGFFGLSTVLNQSLQVLVTKPVERELLKLDEAKERAGSVIAELSFLSSDVEQKGHKAQEAAEAATRKINELESNIRIASESAVQILEQYAHIRSGMSRVSDEIFGLAASIAEDENLLRIEIRKTSQTLNALERLSTAVAESFRSTQVDAALGGFRSDMNVIQTDYVESLDNLARIRSFNIVFYINRPEDDEAAQAIVRELKGEGYRAAVWYAQAGDRRAVVDEIAKEFGNIADILESHASGIVSDPRHQDVAVEIERLLSTRFKTIVPATFSRPLQPANQHLTHNQGQRNFEADKVILIYTLGPATT